MRAWPAVTRSPRSARIRLTFPLVSDDRVTDSAAARVPSTSTARRTVSWRTASTWTGLTAVSRPRACAVSVFEQPAAIQARHTIPRAEIVRLTVCRLYDREPDRIARVNDCLDGGSRYTADVRGAGLFAEAITTRRDAGAGHSRRQTPSSSSSPRWPTRG